MKFLSIVIPVFNEERRLKKTFAGLNELAAMRLFDSLEAVFVDDGSRDRTKAIIEQFSFAYPVKIVSYAGNKGKGFAVKQGMCAAGGDYALMMDADISTPVAEIRKFLPFMADGVPVVIGSRKRAGATMLIQQPWPRRKMGEFYTWLSRALTGVKVSDFTCGFKCFSREAREKIFAEAQIERWSYDAELLFLAKRFGFKICEVPVAWENDRDTRVRLGKDVIGSFVDLLKIRFLAHRRASDPSGPQN